MEQPTEAIVHAAETATQLGFHILELEVLSEVAAEVIGVIGVGIMLYGALKAAGLFVVNVLTSKYPLPKIRIDLGKHLALGLEFLIGQDIIESLIAPTWTDLGMLGGIIILRTVITLFLWWELKEIEEEIKATDEVEKAVRKTTRKRKK